MATKSFNYKPIYAGFPWSAVIGIRTTPALFPEGTRLRAQVRATIDGPVLATLTTENGGLARVEDQSIEINLEGRHSRTWTEGSIILDLVRTDLNPAQHLGIRIKVAVRRSATSA